MRKKLILLAVLMPIFAWADNEQTVTINGTTINKQVKEITFDGDEANVTFTDESSQEVDLSALSIVWSTTNSVNSIVADTDKASDAIYNLNGQYVGTDLDKLPKGIYIVKGHKVVKP